MHDGPVSTHAKYNVQPKLWPLDYGRTTWLYNLLHYCAWLSEMKQKEYKEVRNETL